MGRDLTVSGGAVLSLPGMTNYQGACGSSLEANGSGSVLALPGVTTLTQTCGYGLMIEAENGGQVLLTNVAALSGVISAQADGSNSVLNLSHLANNAGTPLYLEANGGGSVLLPDLVDGNQINLTLAAGGFISTAQFTNINGSSLTVNGGEVLTLSEVTSYQGACGSSLEVNGVGSVLALPGVTNLNETCGNGLTIEAENGGQYLMTNVEALSVVISVQADGSNSVLILSHLANNEGTPLYLEASGGGSVLLPDLTDGNQINLTLAAGGFISTAQLTNINGSSLYVNGGSVLSLPGVANYQPSCGNLLEANGAGSVLALPGLTNLNETCGNGLTIEAENGGQVLLTNVAALSGVISVQADGSNSVLNLSHLANNAGTPLYLEASGGGSVLLPDLVDGNQINLTLAAGGFISTAQLTNINGASLTVNGGEMLTLSGVTSYQGACGSSLEANGVGSVLALPGVTNLNETCGNGLTIEAENGGQVLLTNVAALSGVISVQADGSNSVLNLSHLANNAGTPLYLEASGGGSVLLPDLTDGNQIHLTLAAGGFISTAQLTNIDGSSLYVNGGSVLSLPGVANYQPSCGNLLEANGAGSVLALPGLTNLNETCGNGLTVEAENGGEVLLHNLPTIDNGYVYFLSDGAGSTIDLSSLSAFVLETGQGSLTEQNGGTILFNNQAFLLANVAISIPAGNPVLPPALVASQTLTLYGIPWHSYRVEEWNTLQPGSPVTTFLVPLTNSFQAFATAPQPGTAFLVSDFVANPSILQIGLAPGNEAQLVLYGLTNATYTVQSTTNLRPKITWTPVTVAAMTNAFRILPEIPTTPALQFFRVQQQ